MSVITEKRVFRKPCDNSDTCESILNGPLATVGADLALVNVTEQDDKQGGVDLKVAHGQIAKSIVAT